MADRLFIPRSYENAPIDEAERAAELFNAGIDLLYRRHEHARVWVPLATEVSVDLPSLMSECLSLKFPDNPDFAARIDRLVLPGMGTARQVNIGRVATTTSLWEYQYYPDRNVVSRDDRDNPLVGTKSAGEEDALPDVDELSVLLEWRDQREQQLAQQQTAGFNYLRVGSLEIETLLNRLATAEPLLG